VPGIHLRVDVSHQSPVALGRPAEDFEFNNYDPVMSPTTTGVNVLTYPSDASFWSNGYSTHTDFLKGTAALTDEPAGSGHVVLFAYNPLFRAYEDSGEQLFANAVLYPQAASPAGVTNLASPEGVQRAQAAAQAPAPAKLGGDRRPITFQVGAADLDRALGVVRRYGQPARVSRGGAVATIVIANPRGLEPDQHPFSQALLEALRRAGVDVRAAVL
jgi:hypothetical protein